MIKGTNKNALALILFTSRWGNFELENVQLKQLIPEAIA